MSDAKRYDVTEKYIGTGEYVGAMEESATGDWVAFSDYDARKARLADADANAPWLTQAHMICTDHGIPQGDISDRLEMLVGYLAEAERDEAVALLREAVRYPHKLDSEHSTLRARIYAFLAKLGDKP